MYVEYGNNLSLFEIVNVRKNIWIVRYKQEESDSLSDSYLVEYMPLGKKPNIYNYKETIIRAIDEYTKEKINEGFLYKGIQVKLTLNRQFNYKNAYDAAIATEGKSLPVMFQLDDDNFLTFSTMDEIREFYLMMYNHIQTTLEKGYKMKKNINTKEYESILHEWK